ARYVGDGALQPKPGTRVRSRPVAPQVAVPAVVRSVDAKFGHTRVEHVEPLLPLTATDNLADSRRKDIHRRHGFTVTVNAHVEGFDLLWIVHHNNGLLRVLFRQIALV